MQVKEFNTKERNLNGNNEESNNSDFKDKIEKLNSLMKKGLITEQEFNDKKSDILKRV